MPNRTFALSLGLAGCASAVAMPSDLSAPAASTHTVDHAAISRALGPAGLDALFARYDGLAPGAEKDALALTIDKAAAQRYASESRLYWYTDLATAQAAAALQGKPILSLRMLGRLDEDLSCANSRLFRTTLYANRETANFLKQRFILHWSSERAVPKLTIDYGDGRKVESTTTGNSAHYVLAADGAVLDVLPGVYAPRAFRAELARSLQLATSVAKLDATRREDAVRAYHKKQVTDHAVRAQRLAALARIPALYDERAAIRAQMATVSKAAIELPSIKMFLDLEEVPETNTAAWTALARSVWNLDDARAAAARRALPSADRAIRFDEPAPWAGKAIPRVLDEASRALVTRLHMASPLPTTVEDLQRMLARLETNLLADSALDELRLRPQIHQMIATQGTAFAPLNELVYAKVFHTAAGDAWMGLIPRTDFTGLPGDGVVMPAEKATATAQR